MGGVDPEGLELPDLAAVRNAVLVGARDIIADEVRSGGVIDFRFRIDAENEAGEVVHSLPFKHAVNIIPEGA